MTRGTARSLATPTALEISIVRATTARPVKLIMSGLRVNLPLTPGAIADITIFDPNRNVTVDPAKFKSKSRNTPFGGWQLYGAPVAVVVGGRMVDEEYLQGRS